MQDLNTMPTIILCKWFYAHLEIQLDCISNLFLFTQILQTTHDKVHYFSARMKLRTTWFKFGFLHSKYIHENFANEIL